MTVVKTIFKSLTSENRWIALQKEKAEMQSKPITPALQEKIDVISSIMTSCKVGFNLSEAKVKKVTKFLKEKTGNSNSLFKFTREIIRHNFVIGHFTFISIDTPFYLFL